MAIKIETGPMPAMADPGKNTVRSELQETILKMPPGSWFLVPGTAKKHGRALAGMRSGITRFCKRMKLVGIGVGEAADGSGLIVRKTGELEQRPPAAAPDRAGVTYSNGHLPPSTLNRPKASRL